MATFIADAVLTAAVQDGLGLAPGSDLPDNFDRVVPRANTGAYAALRRAVLARGFSVPQFAGWDDGPQHNTDLGRLWAMWLVAEKDDRPQLWQEIVDYLKALAETDGLVVDDELVYPPVASGRVGFGDLDEPDGEADDPDSDHREITLDSVL